MGDLRTQKSFGGDTQAWHTYQDTVYSKLHPGEALPPGDASRPDLWKAAARQLKKIEAERKKVADADTDADQPGKKLKVSTRWQKKHVPGVSDVPSSARHAPPSLGVRHACTWLVCLAAVRANEGEDAQRHVLRHVRRGRALRPATCRGENDEEAKMRAEGPTAIGSGRELVALEWLSSGYTRPFEKKRGHHGRSEYKKRKTK